MVIAFKVQTIDADVGINIVSVIQWVLEWSWIRITLLNQVFSIMNWICVTFNGDIILHDCIFRVFHYFVVVYFLMHFRIIYQTLPEK